MSNKLDETNINTAVIKQDSNVENNVEMNIKTTAQCYTEKKNDCDCIDKITTMNKFTTEKILDDIIADN